MRWQGKFICRLNRRTSAFQQRNEAIYRLELEVFFTPARPENIDVIDLSRIAKPKMQSMVATRKIARPAANLLHPSFSARAKQGYSGADAIAVGTSTPQRYPEPMVLVRRAIDEQHWLRVDVIDDSGDASVIPEIGRGHAAA